MLKRLGTIAQTGLGVLMVLVAIPMMLGLWALMAAIPIAIAIWLALKFL